MRTDGRWSRRAVLAAVGSAAASLAGCGGADGKWRAVDVPTDATLYDVATTATGAFAVGEGGIVIGRDDGWHARLENGFHDAGEDFRSAAVTSNGRVLWVAGDSGSLGLYDVVSERARDVSEPNGMTSSWTALAVSGLAGDERIRALNGSGELLRGRRDGAEFRWADAIEPGTGSGVTDIDLTSLSDGYLVDSTGDVYESRDEGRSWSRIGVDDVAVDFEAVTAIDNGHVSAVGSDGAIYSYNGVDWTRTELDEAPITAVARERYDALAVASSGAVYERDFDGWSEQTRLDVDEELLAVALGTARTPQLVVGESGTVFEREY